MHWNPEIKELYEKYNTDDEYSVSDEEWELIRSPEYSFYQGHKKLPSYLDTIEAMNERDHGWFDKFLGGEFNTEVADWLCELTQNAFDRGATECIIIVENNDRVLKFGHNGRGIEGPKKKERIGDVYALIEMGLSLKAYDLHSEGRFGVGFKYWKRHFSEVVLNSDGFSLGWTKGYKEIKEGRKEMGSFNKWTLFQFSGDGEEGNVPLNLKIDDLRRLKDAIRMRPTDFKLEITINNSDHIEKCTWYHKITAEEDFEGHRILSCQDSETGAVGDLQSTLMLIAPNSEFFPQHLVTELTDVSIGGIKKINARRIGLGKSALKGEPLELVKKWFSKVPFILGFFHEEGDNGNLLSMFPIRNEGQTDSRISFSAPFHITPTRFNFERPDNPPGTPERNRILIQMMLHSFGQFLRGVQDTGILGDELIQHLLTKPPGEQEDGLDAKIRDYAQEDRRRILYDGGLREKMSPLDVFDSICWPTATGIHRIGDEAKQLDPLLIDYRDKLLNANNYDDLNDLKWLARSLENDAITFHKDENDLPIPVRNWITNLLSQEVGYSGITVELGEEE